MKEQIDIAAICGSGHLGDLTDSEIESWGKAVDDLVTDGPRTPSAIEEYRRLSQKMNMEYRDSTNDRLAKIVTQYVKKKLFGL